MLGHQVRAEGNIIPQIDSRYGSEKHIPGRVIIVMTKDLLLSNLSRLSDGLFHHHSLLKLSLIHISEPTRH
eukprot:12412598-Karenia_brevis.AAC.1